MQGGRSEGDAYEERFARRLRERRVEKGWTQDTLAQRATEAGAPMIQTTVAKTENNTRAVRIGEAVILASVLEVNLYSLVQARWSDEETSTIEGVIDRLHEELRELDTALAERSGVLEELEARRKEHRTLRERRRRLETRLQAAADELKRRETGE